MEALIIIVILAGCLYLLARPKKKKEYDDVKPWWRDENNGTKPLARISIETRQEPRRIRSRSAAVEEISDWMDGLDGGLTDVVVFDTETNGLDHDRFSVLSIGAVRYAWDPIDILKEVGRFERYYYPKEGYYNKDAIKVNGLDKETIDRLRGDANYPEFFEDDKGFKDFCKGVKLFAGHNISFDAGFVPFVKRFRKFDTMKSNTNIVCISNGNGGWKWPTLQETAQYYGVPFDELSTHGAMYDAEIAGKILVKMLQEAGVTIKTTT